MKKEDNYEKALTLLMEVLKNFKEKEVDLSKNLFEYNLMKDIQEFFEELNPTHSELIRKILNSKESLRFVRAYPDEHYPIRILSSHISQEYFTDNVIGAEPKNPLVIVMNKTQDRRNKILKEAITILSDNLGTLELFAKEEVSSDEINSMSTREIGVSELHKIFNFK